MDPSTNLVFWQILWGSIMFIVVFSVSVGCFFDYRKSMMKMRHQLRDIEDNAMQRDMENIKARLAVLEKIVTDRNYDLREELDALKRESS